METMQFIASLIFFGWVLYLVFNRGDTSGKADEDHGIYRYKFYYKDNNEQTEGGKNDN